MSFGVSAVSATQRIAGGDSNEIDYLTDESWEGNETTVLVYDKAECGNGNVPLHVHSCTFQIFPEVPREEEDSLPMSHAKSRRSCATMCSTSLGTIRFNIKEPMGKIRFLHRSMTDYTQFEKKSIM